MNQNLPEAVSDKFIVLNSLKIYAGLLHCDRNQDSTEQVEDLASIHTISCRQDISWVSDPIAELGVIIHVEIMN